MTSRNNPRPKPGQAKSTVDLVIKDLKERKAFGLQKYGVVHQHDNGRNHLQDLYEELLDGAVYVKAEMLKRDKVKK